MFYRVAKFLVLLAALQILGGHWAVLQTVAWTQMFIDYAQKDSLTVAVAKTFDGDHPCSLCQTVSDGRKQEKKQEGPMTVAKLEAVLAGILEVPVARAAAWSYPSRHFALVVRHSTPPTPTPLA